MLAGQRPFTGQSIPQVLLTITAQDVPDLTEFRSNLPTGLVQLVQGMLMKDPGQRLQSVRQVGTSLENILLGRDVSTPLPTTPVTSLRRHHNLPVQNTPFLGRDIELAELSQLLADPKVRLISILGPGGMGKSWLALEAAAGQLDNFNHGVYFVQLAPLDAADGIVAVMAEALNFSFHAGESQAAQLQGYIREKQLLLIMDNYEHLLDGVKVLVDLLRIAPGLKVLATSRSRLNLQEEHRFPLTGIDFPESISVDMMMQSSAVQLFLENARRVQADFALTDENSASIAQICQLVQGMPLGIILAATWLEMLAPAEIVSELSRSLDFLETDLQDLPERQRSFRAVFDYSWRLLSQAEQEVFQQLSIFRGGFTREAAQEVTGASLRSLMGLVNKSFLQRADKERFMVHELLRQFGEDYLSNDSALNQQTRSKHSLFYQQFLTHCEPLLKGKDQQNTLQRIALDYENCRLALLWAAENGEIEDLLKPLEAIGWFLFWRHLYQQGVDLFKQLYYLASNAHLPNEQHILAYILTWQIKFLIPLSLPAQAEDVLARAQTLFNQATKSEPTCQAVEAFFLELQGDLYFQHNAQQAKVYYERSRILAQASGNTWVVVRLTYKLGFDLPIIVRY